MEVEALNMMERSTQEDADLEEWALRRWSKERASGWTGSRKWGYTHMCTGRRPCLSRRGRPSRRSGRGERISSLKSDAEWLLRNLGTVRVRRVVCRNAESD